MPPLTLVIGSLNYSSWSVRPWLALKHAGLPFEEVPICFSSPTAKEEILRYCGAGTVPILLHGDTKVWASLAICEYVAELAPDAQLWPEDPAARAHARAVSAEMVGGFPNLRQHMPMNARARYPGRGRAAGVQEEIDRVCEIWRECRERYAAHGPFLFGVFSIADCMYAPVASRFVTYGVPVGPVEEAYLNALWRHPSIHEWLEVAKKDSERLPEYEFDGAGESAVRIPGP